MCRTTLLARGGNKGSVATVGVDELALFVSTGAPRLFASCCWGGPLAFGFNGFPPRLVVSARTTRHRLDFPAKGHRKNFGELPTPPARNPLVSRSDPLLTTRFRSDGKRENLSTE